MVEVLRGSQTTHKVVSVSIVVLSALDLAQVRNLVDVSGGLVLSMAGSGQRGESREVEVAVDHQA